MEFKNITKTYDLKAFLDSKRRLKECKYLSHYTKYERLVEILKSNKLYLSNAKGMNDQLEYKNGYQGIWDRLYFASLIMNRRESIGMWAVYAQPWEDGIKISFLTEDVKKWVSSLDKIYIVDKHEKIIEKPQNINGAMKCFISSVVYTNTDSKDSNDEKEKILWNTVENKHIKSASKIPELTGYIKDMAWAYEREMRIKVLFDNPVQYHRIAVDIQPLMKNMTITTGPLFSGSVQQRLQNDLPKYDEFKFNFRQSIFQNNFIN